MSDCTNCDGKGTVKCEKCGGSGRVRNSFYVPGVSEVTKLADDYEDCVYCDGEGEKTCYFCDGSGYRSE